MSSHEKIKKLYDRLGHILVTGANHTAAKPILEALLAFSEAEIADRAAYSLKTVAEGVIDELLEDIE